MDIMEENLSIYIFSWKAHMGQIPQDGENGQNVAFFHFFWSSAVTKRFDFLNFINCSEEISPGGF